MQGRSRRKYEYQLPGARLGKELLEEQLELVAAVPRVAGTPTPPGPRRDDAQYWIPAEELETFNNNIVGVIRVVDEFLVAAPEAERS